MGKRKAAKKQQGPKKREPLSTIFPCLFCNHEKSVSVKLDKKAQVGHLQCKICNQQFQCGINYLSAAVDVYSDWVDACDAVAKENGDKEGEYAPERAPTQGGRPSGGRQMEEEEDDNDIIDDEDDDLAPIGGYGAEGIEADDDY
ncbi:putative transcription elongation factor [Calycina marina]|uniref:Transcription elongation factor 1 homolog n=1 Tax=Calycina marina TaxID=1763456 RepID=A0A9P8CI11_9HELO|nr:putative transcription elongation factor [Calycina marina]